jgi:hypothetical protein
MITARRFQVRRLTTAETPIRLPAPDESNTPPSLTGAFDSSTSHDYS